MQRIFLTGYMGAGKTTLGRDLSDFLGLSFIDLDVFIEERFHKTIRQIFAERGEEAFRELERRMLHEVAEFEDIIVSTGGGTPYTRRRAETIGATGANLSSIIQII